MAALEEEASPVAAVLLDEIDPSPTDKLSPVLGAGVVLPPGAAGTAPAARDAAAAADRFERMDVNKDGVVTREEFISNGGKKLK